MNKEWSKQNKAMQALLKKATFRQAIEALIELRKSLMEEMQSWRGKLSEADFSEIPFINAEGYHSKTVAYSIWHIMRIEDIVVNTLIRRREEVLFAGDHQRKTGSPIITTGNELVKEQIAAFSRELDIAALYEYAEAVREDTDRWLRTMNYEDLKRRFPEEDKERIRALHVVSADESAAWLIGYWCGKDVAGLLKMPLSRHWIMHIEAAGRIIGRLGK
ncbi:MAG: phage head-tail adapter protein [Clostridia bacterium]|nr:phage head-tail adapter protein [Clostridia bacterium]MBQ6232899.1 phage head-tail adapter protein [Clostridia bacterium]